MAIKLKSDKCHFSLILFHLLYSFYHIHGFLSGNSVNKADHCLSSGSRKVNIYQTEDAIRSLLSGLNTRSIIL